MRPSARLRESYTLEPGWAYLNHGSYGGCPREVQDVADGIRARIERNPHDFFARRLPGLLEETRARVAEAFGLTGPDAEGLVLQQNATTALATAAAGLGLRAGDEVLITDAEYETVILAWRRIADAAGARIVTVPLPNPVDDSAAVLDAFEAARTPRTVVVVVSHITSSTAVVLPVTAISAWAVRHGISTVVDGAHAPGQLDLDLEELARAGVSAYAGDLHKWVSAPRGTGFLWVDERLRSRIAPLVPSWGMLEYDTFAGHHLRRETHDPAPMLAVPAALEFQSDRVTGESRAESAELLEMAGAALLAVPGVTPFATGAGLAPRMRAFLLPLAASARQRLTETFLAERIEVQLAERSERLLMRLSIAPYVSEDDIRRWQAVLETALNAYRDDSSHRKEES